MRFREVERLAKVTQPEWQRWNSHPGLRGSLPAAEFQGAGETLSSVGSVGHRPGSGPRRHTGRTLQGLSVQARSEPFTMEMGGAPGPLGMSETPSPPSRQALGELIQTHDNSKDTDHQPGVSAVP